MGALTPLGKVAGGRPRWLVNVAAYTLAGLATSAYVGAVLGALGSSFVPDGIRRFGLAIAVGLAGVAIARGFGWTSFALPRVRRQTRDVWGKRFDGTAAATLWGMDVGLAFTTRFTFSGLSVLTAVAVAAGSPGFGAVIFVALWLGRALPPWMGPLLLPDANATPQFLDSIDRQRALFRRIHLVGLSLLAASLLIAATTHSSPLY